MISMGLDLSLNSTGVCIYNNETKSTIYYIIGCKFTKKALSIKNEYVILKPFEKHDADAKAEYHVKELFKTQGICEVVDGICELLERYHPQVCTIEGISFGSRGDVIGLSGLNYAIRYNILTKYPDTILYIVSPTQNKKFATGNGLADKDAMMAAWRITDKNAGDIPSCIKQDDIADAYFLARYGVELKGKE